MLIALHIAGGIAATILICVGLWKHSLQIPIRIAVAAQLVSGVLLLLDGAGILRLCLSSVLFLGFYGMYEFKMHHRLLNQKAETVEQ